MSATLFQFHKGAIRTAEEYLCHNLDLYFNSIKVRLELTPILEIIDSYIISIP